MELRIRPAAGRRSPAAEHQSPAVAEERQIVAVVAERQIHLVGVERRSRLAAVEVHRIHHPVEGERRSPAVVAELVEQTLPVGELVEQIHPVAELVERSHPAVELAEQIRLVGARRALEASLLDHRHHHHRVASHLDRRLDRHLDRNPSLYCLREKMKIVVEMSH